MRNKAAGRKGVAQLLVQIRAVRYQHNARLAAAVDGRVQRQLARQHHHGQRLARALGVPDNATLARAVCRAALDGRQHLLDGKHLLVTRHLALPGIKHGVGKSELEQALRAQHAVKRAVLHRGLALYRVGRMLLCNAVGCALAFTQLSLRQFKQAGLHVRRKRLGHCATQLGLLC